MHVIYIKRPFKEICNIESFFLFKQFNRDGSCYMFIDPDINVKNVNICNAIPRLVIFGQTAVLCTKIEC